MSVFAIITPFSAIRSRGAPNNEPIYTGAIFMTRYRSTLVTLSAASLFVVLASGCTDVKPVQAQLDDLKAQLNQISPKIASADSQAMAAGSSARAAATTAQQAQSTADKANAMAKSNQQAIEAINEKIDRMFKKSVSK
jgi:outer membrane murein-binding lipoprotein Lpp